MPPSRARCLRNRNNYGLSRCILIFFARKKMTRPIALLIAALTLLAGAGHAQAQGFFGPDTRELMNTGPSFFGGGASPIPRTTVSYAGGYAPGTIVINTGERRLYLVLGNGQALRYGIGVGRDGFPWGGTPPLSAQKG